jgi:hypothetical protein
MTLIYFTLYSQLQLTPFQFLPSFRRQIIVPDGPLSYPSSDYPHDVVGPKPSTFSGQRALNFVLQNEAGTIDKTLLFNVKVVRVDVGGVVDKQRR